MKNRELVRPGRFLWVGLLATLLASGTLAGAQSAQVQATPEKPAASDATKAEPDAERLKALAAAAEGGDAVAQRDLGVEHLAAGRLAEGAKWVRRSAKQGNIAAQWLAGGLYEQGQGVPVDAAEAARWYRCAAEQGETLAQGSLALMYMKGNGVAKDNVLAYFWLNVAAANPLGGEREKAAEPSNGARAAGEKVAGLDRALRDNLAVQMTPEQIAEAQRLSREFKPKKWREVTTKPELAALFGADASGSGFFITPDGYFVTNRHVVADAWRVSIRSANGSLPAVVVREDAANDLVVLKVQGTFDSLLVRPSSGVRVADRVFTVGFPNPLSQGLTPKYSSGEVAALAGPGDDPRFLQVSVPVQPGNSGGPLVDSSGAVVGVIVGQLNKIATLRETGAIPENVNYAVKGTLLASLIESLPDVQAKLRHEPAESAADAGELAKRTEKAVGLVLIEK